MKNLILILGANGIGKSTISAQLLRLLPNSAYIDSDYCRMMNPAQLNDETVFVNKKNILDLMLNYFGCSIIDNVIFPYGFHGHRKQLFNDLLNELKKKVDFRLYTILLVCDEAENIRRLKADNRDDERIERALRNTRNIFGGLDCPTIDITELSPVQSAERIMKIIIDMSKSY
ncbi:hypothetical protein SDC9_121574 [bioreactor metagenome]|uniref:Uncharacterized protein n=1 Tax=bioreactor metagenome TaxID=1076179 RepID=A0A645CCA5_9ZZZZ|nr:AAA family ATPase [Oscillospiraceae bacterium]